MRPTIAVVVCLLAGCSTSASNEKAWPQPAALTAPEPEAEPQPAEEPGVSGRYSGSYVCPQGPTALFLLVEQKPEGRLEAVFEFGPHADNPDVPIGSFRMQGWVDEYGAMELNASEQDWLQRPEGYITVDLRGTFHGDQVSGDVVNEECTTFSATRQ